MIVEYIIVCTCHKAYPLPIHNVLLSTYEFLQGFTYLIFPIYNLPFSLNIYLKYIFTIKKQFATDCDGSVVYFKKNIHPMTIFESKKST